MAYSDAECRAGHRGEVRFELSPTSREIWPFQKVSNSFEKLCLFAKRSKMSENLNFGGKIPPNDALFFPDSNSTENVTPE